MKNTWMMLLVQSIPFWAMFAMTFINFKIKKRFFCISNLALLYITLAMFGSIFMVLRPRTGWSYVRLDAMLFLTVCFILLTLPALFFKDGKKDDQIEFTDLPDKAVQKISVGLIFLTVPASIISAAIAIPDMIKFFQMGGNRGAFRNQLIDYGGGFSSLPQFLIQFGLSFGLIALFWLVYCVIFNKLDKWRIIFLAIGAFGPCIYSLRQVARITLFYTVLFAVICVLIFFKFIQKTQKNKLKKYGIIAIFLLTLPFMAISISRFKSDICYSFYSYFATGPYSFNTDYAARVDGKTKPLNGYLTIGWHLFVFDKITGSNHYEQAMRYDKNYHYSGNPSQATSPEIDSIYRRISGAYSAEFPTFVGIFLKDYHIWQATVAAGLFSIFFTVIFYLTKKTSVPQKLCACIYFYILAVSTMLWPFMRKGDFFKLVLIFAFIILLYCLQSKQSKTENAKKNKNYFIKNNSPDDLSA